MDKVTLLTNGSKIAGWDNLTVKKSLSNLCSEFSLEIVPSPALKAISESNDAIELYLGDDLVLTGYLDDISSQKNNSGYTSSISGRSKTADLIDCSAINSPGTWKNITLFRLIEELCKPVGISVVNSAKGDFRFESFSIDLGESIFESCTRACSVHAVMMQTSPKGELILFNEIGTVRGQKLFDDNTIISVSNSINFKDRFSDYYVTCQGKNQTNSWDKDSISTIAQSIDSMIGRDRSLLIKMDGSFSKQDLQNRANWEAQVRYGKSKAISIEVPEWRQNDGSLWDINLKSYINIEALEVDADFIVDSVSYKFSNSGQTTLLEFVPHFTYKSEPQVVVTDPAPSTTSYGW